ncbi:MAG TPA: ammonium transporter [Longimicrobium sp.]|jgi:Amt family ammonium transporter|uniref:ammonium transporter n=1 Tax=Longimicrobium sp. TaxID=2029185 RepID=UPI002EDA7ADE
MILQADAGGAVPISAGDTAWLLVSTALVLLMTPALGFFYGGLVRSKNMLNTLMMSFASLGVVTVAWAAIGFSLAFAPGNAWLGGAGHAFLVGVGVEGGAWGPTPHLLYAAYQGSFAIITAALISGAVVERMRFGPYLSFIFLWSIAVYAPVARWVWGGGWLGTLGALDFAGGTVVHINAAVAAVVAALVVGSRRDYGRAALLPHNVSFVLLGTGLLWFGWFGFNGGSALAANGTAALAFVNTLLAPAATLVCWMLLDAFRERNITAVGAATGIVVGLVGITPAAGFVSPASAMALGALVAFPSYFAILHRPRTRLDDSLDVFAAHGLGGITGALLVGVFAEKAWGGKEGLLFGNPGQLWTQAVAVVASAAYSALATWLLLKLISLVTPLRRPDHEEARGLDLVQHGEEAYTRGEGAVLVQPR